MIFRDSMAGGDGGGRIDRLNMSCNLSEAEGGGMESDHSVSAARSRSSGRADQSSRGSYLSRRLGFLSYPYLRVAAGSHAGFSGIRGLIINHKPFGGAPAGDRGLESSEESADSVRSPLQHHPSSDGSCDTAADGHLDEVMDFGNANAQSAVSVREDGRGVELSTFYSADNDDPAPHDLGGGHLSPIQVRDSQSAGSLLELLTSAAEVAAGTVAELVRT